MSRRVRKFDLLLAHDPSLPDPRRAGRPANLEDILQEITTRQPEADCNSYTMGLKNEMNNVTEIKRTEVIAADRSPAEQEEQRHVELLRRAETEENGKIIEQWMPPATLKDQGRGEIS
jgi:hypothetical protein